MSQAKHYTISLEVRQPDGSLCGCQLTASPIGSSSTTPGSFWTQLLNNLADTSRLILKPEEMDSSRWVRHEERENS